MIKSHPKTYPLLLLLAISFFASNAFATMNTSETLKRLLSARTVSVQYQILSHFTSSETLSFARQMASKVPEKTWDNYWTQRGIMDIILKRLSEPDALQDPESVKLYSSLIRDKRFNESALYFLRGKNLNPALLAAANSNARQRITDAASTDNEKELAMAQLRSLHHSKPDTADHTYFLHIIRDPSSTPSLVSSAFESVCQLDGPLPYVDEFTTFSDSAKLGFLACLIQYSVLTQTTFSSDPKTNQHMFDNVWKESKTSKNPKIREACYRVLGTFVFPQLAKYDTDHKFRNQQNMKFITVPPNFLSELRRRYDSETDSPSHLQIQALIDGVVELQKEGRIPNKHQ